MASFQVDFKHLGKIVSPGGDFSFGPNSAGARRGMVTDGLVFCREELGFTVWEVSDGVSVKLGWYECQKGTDIEEIEKGWREGRYAEYC